MGVFLAFFVCSVVAAAVSVGDFAVAACGGRCAAMIFRKKAWDIRKTMSYVGKITSDIMKTTSDIIFAFAKF